MIEVSREDESEVDEYAEEDEDDGGDEDDDAEEFWRRGTIVLIFIRRG